MPQIKANGLSFEYESFGSVKDPAILMIMGFSAQLTMWPVELCESLASRGYRVIRFDNRDIGKSEKLDRLGKVSPAEAFAKLMSGQTVTPPYTLNDMAADAVGLLHALGIAKAHIVGASMGGMIAQLVALDHPQNTLSLTSIMSTTGRPGLPPGKPEAMAVLTQTPDNLERETRIVQAMKIWRIIGSQPAYAASDVELRSQAEREVDRTPYGPDGMARQLVAVVTAPPRHERLKAVKAPTLVIHGTDDPLVSVEGGKDTAACIPGARLKLVAGMGHDFTSKLVPVYLREIADFVAEVDSRRGK
ncbi:MAG: alpha/beta fold hydrolase [Alphaproteobacteria bacterium]|nr:alpha/beta fold hydrolase [Alphaproteobacteria bacterium]